VLGMENPGRAALNVTLKGLVNFDGVNQHRSWTPLAVPITR
jgi:hypothetical protein